MGVSAASRVGSTIGRLTIKSTYRENKRSYYVCDCSCGVKDFHTRVDSVQSKATVSCGCWIKEHNGMKTHGMYNSRVYKIWCKMKRRTCNPNERTYKRYGGEGVTMTKDWENFDNFYKDMGDPPSDKHSIDRIDGSKGYSKSNCRWATDSIQAKNQKKRNKSSSSSVYKGVCFDKRHKGCWNVSVTKNYTTVRISTGKDEILSAKYFNFMTEYLYGDIVKLNPVDHLTLTLEQAIHLHSRIEDKFYYDNGIKDYAPREKKL